MTRPCAGFVWLGQTFASCDTCGLPYWEHSHEMRVAPGSKVFEDRWELVPITPESAAATKARWS